MKLAVPKTGSPHFSPNSSSILKAWLSSQPCPSNLIFHWQVDHSNCQHSLIFQNLVFAKLPQSQLCRNAEYQCTPLDYGAIVTATAVQVKQNQENVLVESQFGPIQVEREIGDCFGKEQLENVQMSINKGHFLQTKVHILNKSEDKSINLLFQASEYNFSFELKMNKNVRLPTNNSFFKFYEKEQQCLGISMYHQHSEFMQSLKKIKVFTHLGFYIKIHFQNRLFRDAFLFKVMQTFGVKLSEYIIQAAVKNQQNGGTRKSVTENCEKLKRNNTQQNAKKKEEIDDEIYKLLYEASEAGQKDQMSIDLADAEVLFASTNKCALNSSRLKQLKNSNCESLEKRSQFLTEKNQNKQLTDIKNYENEKRIAQLEVAKFINTQQFINPKNSLFKKQQKQCGNENLRTTISKLTTQIQNLLKQNKKLSQQNKKLRDQNMRLRFKQIKSYSSKYPIEKQKQRKNKMTTFAQTQTPQIHFPNRFQSFIHNSPTVFRGSRSKSRLNNDLINQSRSETRNLTNKFATQIKTIKNTSLVVSPAKQNFHQWNSNHISPFNVASSYKDLQREPKKKNYNISMGEIQKNNVSSNFYERNKTISQRQDSRFRSPIRLATSKNLESKILKPTNEFTSQIIPSPTLKLRNPAITESHYINNFHR